MNSRNCKIIATYFGNRRYYPQTAEDTIEVLKDFIKNEQNLDPGVDNLDVIFINHDCGNKEGKTFLDKVDGKKIFCGIIRVFHRDWDNGAGLSLGSYNYGFKKLKDEYDYWFFHEDDYKIIKKDYYGKGVNILKNNKDIAMVGYDMVKALDAGELTYTQTKNHIRTIRILKIIFGFLIKWWGYGEYKDKHHEIMDKTIKLISQGQPTHAAGPCALTHIKFLNLIVEKNGDLPHHNIPNPQPYKPFKRNKSTVNSFMDSIKQLTLQPKYTTWHWLHCILGELEFSRVYYDLGFRITAYPDKENLLYSYKIKNTKKVEKNKKYY